MDKLLTKLSICLTFIVILIDKTSGSIRCYECSVVPKRQQNSTIEKLCTKFDGSKDYEIDCPYSNMCMKRTYRLELLNGDVQETIERGCAMQKYDSLEYIGGKWIKKHSIEDPYHEGCLISSKDGSEYCHCRGNLCNSVGRIEANSNSFCGIDTISIIVVYNLVKYFINMEYL